jgi:molybdopterin-containing oxidoreductase family iron-sulfur binding subunit
MAACPYNARYFNWRDPKWPAGMEETLNPDVAPRMRGVVEKCNFCHGRRHAAEQAGHPEYTPACAEACPSGAIRFVDLNAQTPRGEEHFRLLERLGTDTKIYYHSKREWVRRMGEAPRFEEERRG